MLALLLVSLLWAFSFGLIKGNLSGVDANFIAAARLGFAVLVFLPFLRLNKVPGSLKWKLFLIGAAQFGLMYIAYNYAFNYLSAYEVALFTVFTPIYVTLINDFNTRKLHRLNLVTAVLAVVGTVIVVSNGWKSNDILVGFLLVQLSNIGFAFGQVAYKKVMGSGKTILDRDVFGILFLGGFALAALSSAVFTPWSSMVLTSKHVFTLIYLGFVASGLGFFLWNYGARKVEAGTLAIFNDLKIPLSILVSLTIFNEKANLVNLLIGGMIVVAALAIQQWSLRRKKVILEAS